MRFCRQQSLAEMVFTVFFVFAFVIIFAQGLMILIVPRAYDKYVLRDPSRPARPRSSRAVALVILVVMVLMAVQFGRDLLRIHR